MTRIPFAEVCFFDPAETRASMEERLGAHLLRLRGHPDINDPGGDPALVNFQTKRRLDLLGSSHDLGKIQRRVQRILELRRVRSGMTHLRREDRERIDVLRNGVDLVSIPHEHRADEIAAAIHSEAPWLAAATEVVWRAMRRSVREGWPGLRLPPMLLDGPPGIGKSNWAHRLGEFLSLPTTVVEATNDSASFGLVGSQRGWANAQPGRLVETVLRTLTANPIVLIDEVDKAGAVTSSNGQAFSLPESLLPLLEPLTAKRWSCPYFQIRFDMRFICWVLTSNDATLLPAPLLSRCPPIRLRNLTSDELAGFVRREGERRNLSDLAIETTIEALSHLSQRRHQLNLRDASRRLQHAADLEANPPLH